MRTYVRSGHAGVSLGCLGTVVLGAVALLALEAAVAAAVVVGAVAVLVAVVRAVDAHRARSSRGLRMPRAGKIRPGEHWVYRDRWPHAVREGSWLDRR